jgi:hypothetical protein
MAEGGRAKAEGKSIPHTPSAVRFEKQAVTAVRDPNNP